MLRFVRTSLVLLALLATAPLGAEDAPPKGEPVVNFKQLLPFLPSDLSGWTAGKPEGNTMRMGAVELTTVSRDYKKGENTSQIQIIDYSLQREIIQGMTAMWQFSNESTDGYQKSFTVDGLKGFETWNESDKKTEVFVMVADRYWVHLEVTGEKPEVAREWLKKIDLKALAALK